MNDRLTGISAFVEAVEAGSFALAAERMQLTRSAVGKSIARLEQRLGVRLFQRTTRSQSLTDDGQAYYERCVRALAELDAGHAALDSGKSEPVGRLRVTAPVLFGRHCVAPLLLQLTQQFPQLNVEMSFNDRNVDLVEEGFDLAVRIGPPADSATLVARRLATQNMAICAAPAYLQAHGKPDKLSELTRHAGIAYGRNGQASPWRVRDEHGQLCTPQPQIRLILDDIQAVADAAVAGAGLAWLPCWLMAKHARAGELQPLLDSADVLPSEIHAVWPQSRYLPSKTRVAIDALVAGIPRMMGELEQAAR
ncbi:LysR family transcriptional regulator [Paucibacter sp. AS339]|uniref:LysR family transcriptional regulator n=1 Tax=Paucibacter hankyongi TaxID=3133434 RepID=UPI0030AF8417